MIDKVFYQCVHVLRYTANRLGISYNQINVWIFCVIWPAITIALIIKLAAGTY